MVRLIVFDLDGVLVSAEESKELHFKSLNEALRLVDPKFIITREEHLSTYDGRSTNQKLQMLTLYKGLDQKFYKEIWDNKQKFTWNEILNSYKRNDRIGQILADLKNADYSIAVASNAVRKTVLLMLAKKGYIEYVDLFVSNEDIDNPKPHPEIYWKCMKEFKVLPSETLIVEDSHIGRESADHSGAHLLGISDEPELTFELIMSEINKIDNKSESKSYKWKDSKLTVLIPMAGEGKRFLDAGYTFPKPLIDIGGKPMIQKVVENLNMDARFIFIVRKSHYEKYNLQYMFNLIAPNNIIISTDIVTEGAACTTLLAERFINNRDPLLIANSDQLVEWNSNIFMYSMKDRNIDGGILTFTSVHPKWSYVKLDDMGFVAEVAEKKVISNIATVGIYYWQRGEDYVLFAKQMIGKNIRTNNEFYVAPVFNEAIANGALIKPFNIEKMYGLGTPEDLEEYQRTHNK